MAAAGRGPGSTSADGCERVGQQQQTAPRVTSFARWSMPAGAQKAREARGSFAGAPLLLTQYPTWTSTRIALRRSVAASAEAPAPLVRVRYWACGEGGGRRGRGPGRGATVADAVDARSRARHGDEPGFDKVLSVCSFLVGEAPLGTRDPAEVACLDGDVLDVLPPYAGG